MGFLSCKNPISMIVNGENIDVRCRKCSGCIKQRQYEWKNRMLLESFGIDYKPLFMTWTFKPSEYVDSRAYVLAETQKLYKRVRRWGHDLRYFTSIERGTKNGRLHAHSIIWSKSLSKLQWTDCFWTLLHAWNKGGIKLRYVQSAGAFHYTSKYLAKELLHDIDYTTGESKRRRNYTFSNNPRLGDKGLQRWEYLTDQVFHVEQYPEQLPPNWFNMIFQGKLVKAYIPSDNWKKYLKSRLRDSTVEDINIDSLELEENIELFEKTPQTVIEWVSDHVAYME